MCSFPQLAYLAINALVSMDEILACSLKTISCCWFSVATEGREDLSYFIRGEAEASRYSFYLNGAINTILFPEPGAQKLHAKCSDQDWHWTHSKCKAVLLPPTLSLSQMEWGSKLFLNIFQSKIPFIQVSNGWRWWRHAWLLKQTLAANMNSSKIL